MRVLHVITALAVGGAEGQLVGVAEHSRHDVEVACLAGFGQAGEELRSKGIPVFDLDLPGRYDPRVLPRLVRLMRRRRYDLVHVHLFRAALYGPPAARLAGVPMIVYTEHTIGEDEIEGLHAGPFVRFLYRSSMRFTDHTIAVSPWVEGQMRAWGVAPGHTTVIPNGIDVGALRFDPAARARARSDLGIPDDALVIGTVGRMIPRKQQSLLIGGAAPLVREGGWLVLVGDGETRTALEKEVAALGIGDRSLFTGTRHDIPAVLAAMDVFASLASPEMFGLAPVEALASGLPVLVTHCPPLEGLGPPHVHWVSQHREDVERALRAAAADPPRRSQAAALAHERFDVGGTAASIDALYERLESTPR